MEQAIYQLVQDFWTTNSSKNVGFQHMFYFHHLRVQIYLVKVVGEPRADRCC